MGPQKGSKVTWEVRYKELVQYKEAHGHCQVPRNYSLNPQLGVWVHNQRNHYLLKHKCFTAERFFLLDGVGFNWKVNESNTESYNFTQPIVNSSLSKQLWTQVKSLHEKELFWSCNLLLNMSENTMAVLMIDLCNVTEKNPIQFPKSAFSGCTKQNFKEIHKQLYLSARNSGFTLAIRKHYHAKNGEVVGIKFGCTSGRCYRTSIKNYASKEKENQCTIPRQTRSICPTDSSHRCSWSITIRYDFSYGGFLASSCSGNKHYYHIRRSPESISCTKFLSREEILQLKLHEECRVPSAATRRVMFNQMGMMLTRQQLHFLKEKDVDSSGSKVEKLFATTSASQLLDDLDGMGDVFYIALVDDPLSNLYSVQSKGRPSKAERIRLPEGDDYVTYLRKALKVDNDAKVLLGVAWTTKDAIRYALAFPERMIIDTTYKSNIEKRALFLASGITSSNTSFIGLQAYLPCERGWVFQWLFRDAIPLLLGNSFLSRNCLVASDGDVAIYNTFLSIKEQGKLWQNSDHMLCAFHLINQHYDKHVSSSHKKVRPLWKIAKNWMYTWIDDCETESEYKVSRNMFEKWLNNLSGESGDEKVIKAFSRDTFEFVKIHLDPYESRWVRYLRLHVNNFDNKTTSVAESSNALLMRNGLGPMDQLHVASKKITSILRECFSRKNSEAERLASSTAVKSSFFLEHNDLTPYALKVVNNQWDARNEYASAKMTEVKYLVRHETAHLKGEERMNPIPTFLRVRAVCLQGGKLHCSCGFYSRHRLPCRHMLHVLNEMRIEYCGVRWTTLYAQYYGTDHPIATKLAEIQMKESNGIQITDEKMNSKDINQIPYVYSSQSCVDLSFFSGLEGTTMTLNNDGKNLLSDHSDGMFCFGRVSQIVESDNNFCFGRDSQINEYDDNKEDVVKAHYSYSDGLKIYNEIASIAESSERVSQVCLTMLEDVLVKAKEMAHEEMLNERRRNNSVDVSTSSCLVSSNIPIEKDRVYHRKKARHEYKYT